MKDTGSVLNIQEITHAFLVKKKKLILYSICICIDITLLRTVADDLLKCEKIESILMAQLFQHSWY